MLGLKEYIPVARHCFGGAESLSAIYHKTSAAIDFPSRKQNNESISLKGLIYKLSQQAEEATARAGIAVIEAVNTYPGYVGKVTKLELGGWKKFIKGSITDWKLPKRWR